MSAAMSFRMEGSGGACGLMETLVGRTMLLFQAESSFAGSSEAGPAGFRQGNFLRTCLERGAALTLDMPQSFQYTYPKIGCAFL